MPDRQPLAVLSGRLGAYRLHATHDPRETTVAARAAFRAKFEREVDAADPEGKLDPVERARRVEYARRAHFASLAYRSAKVRAARKRTGRPADEAPIADEADDDR